MGSCALEWVYELDERCDAASSTPNELRDDGRDINRRVSSSTVGPSIGRRRETPGPLRYIQRLDGYFGGIRCFATGPGETHGGGLTRDSVLVDSEERVGIGVPGVESSASKIGVIGGGLDIGGTSLPLTDACHDKGACTAGTRTHTGGAISCELRTFPRGGARNGTASILDVLLAELMLLIESVRPVCKSPSLLLIEAWGPVSCTVVSDARGTSAWATGTLL